MTAPTNIYIYKNDPRSCKCGKCGKMCAVFLEEEGLNIDGFDTISPKNVFIGKIEGNDEDGVSDNSYIKFKNEASGYTTIGSSNIEKISDFMYRVIPQCNCWCDQLTGRKPATVLLCDNNLVCDKCGIKIQKNIDANICAGEYGSYNYTFVRRETELETQSLNSITLTESDFTDNAVLILTNLVPISDDESEEVSPCCDCDEYSVNKDIVYTNYYPNIRFSYVSAPLYRTNTNSRDIKDADKSRYKFYYEKQENNNCGKTLLLSQGTLEDFINYGYTDSISTFINNNSLNIDNLSSNITTEDELLEATPYFEDWFYNVEITTESDLINFITNNENTKINNFYSMIKKQGTADVVDMPTFKTAYTGVFFNSSATHISSLTDLKNKIFIKNGSDISTPSFTDLTEAKTFLKSYWLLYSLEQSPFNNYDIGSIFALNKTTNPLLSDLLNQNNILINDSEIDNCETVYSLIELLYNKSLLIDYDDIDDQHISNIVEIIKRLPMLPAARYNFTQSSIDNLCWFLTDEYNVNCSINDLVIALKETSHSKADLQKIQLSIIDNTEITKLNIKQNEGFTDISYNERILFKYDLNAGRCWLDYSDTITPFMTYEEFYKQNLITSLYAENGSDDEYISSILADYTYMIAYCFDFMCANCEKKYVLREDLTECFLNDNYSSDYNTSRTSYVFQKNEECDCINGGIKIKYNSELTDENILKGKLKQTRQEIESTLSSSLDLTKEYPMYLSCNAYDCFGEEKKSYPVLLSYTLNFDDRYSSNLKSNPNTILTKSTAEDIELAWQITYDNAEDAENAVFTPTTIENEYITALGYTTQWNNENSFDNANYSMYFDNLKDNTSDSIYAPMVSLDNGCGNYGISNSILGPWDEDGNNMNENEYSSSDISYYEDTDKKNSFNYRYAIEVGHLDYLLGSYVAPEPTPTPTPVPPTPIPDNKYVIRYYYNDFDYNFTSSIVYSNTIDVSHIKKK